MKNWVSLSVLPMASLVKSQVIYLLRITKMYRMDHLRQAFVSQMLTRLALTQDAPCCWVHQTKAVHGSPAWWRGHQSERTTVNNSLLINGLHGETGGLTQEDALGNNLGIKGGFQGSVITREGKKKQYMLFQKKKKVSLKLKNVCGHMLLQTT